jgi:hypothetical protein
MAYHHIDWNRLENLRRAGEPATKSPPRASKRRRRECVPVEKAREAYARLGNWRLVSEEIRREDGTKFTEIGIKSAVYWADKGNAGRRT